MTDDVIAWAGLIALGAIVLGFWIWFIYATWRQGRGSG